MERCRKEPIRGIGCGRRQSAQTTDFLERMSAEN